ncbi:MAG: hypothetical protein SVR04_15765, partial [Spirochaetota bacterium]|nr:hypothetical protein [Spirochaetota bacterium]
MISSRFYSSSRPSRRKPRRDSRGEPFFTAAVLLLGAAWFFSGCRGPRNVGDASDADNAGENDPIVISVSVEPELMERWEELRASCPLPDMVLTVSDGVPNSGGKSGGKKEEPAGNLETADARLEIIRVSNGSRPDPAAGSRVIELDCVPIVPAVPLWDPRFDVDRETAEDLPRLAGVDRPSTRQGTNPNLKGVSVEGMFPFHPDYPLNERIFLVFQWSTSE